MKFLDPKNDVAFRKIFGDENKKEILISFLNNILNFAGTDKEITGISIQNPYQVPRLKRLKETILDIKAIDKRNIQYIIEMQVFHTEALEKRVQYYVSKAYSQQLNKGEDYPRLNQVIFLGFLDFVFFKDIPDYATRHLFLEERTNGHYFKDFDLNFVELPKFNLELHQLKSIKEKWIYFVKNAGDMTIIPKELEEPRELKEALDVANRMSWTKEELDLYDTRGILIQDERGRVQHAMRAGYEEGEKKGFENGEKKGYEKGEKSGFDKGKKEVARAMLKEGMARETISRLTGVPIDEITG